MPTEISQLNENSGKDNLKTTTDLLRAKILTLLQESYASTDVPMCKAEAVRILSNRFRLSKHECFLILSSLNEEGLVIFQSRRKVVLERSEGGHG